MRIRCRNCETAFDYDKHEGYCPRCGSFNEKPEKPERAQKKKRSHASERVSRRQLLRRWAIGIIAALILLPIVGAPVMKYMGERDYRKIRAERIETTEVAIGETTAIGEYEYTTLDTEWHAMKIDRKFLQVEYELKSYLYDTETMLQNTVQIYLCADGEYILPYGNAGTLRSQLMPEDEYRDHIYDDAYTQSLNQEHGSLAFVTPVDVEEAFLLIVVYDKANDGTGSGVAVPVQKLRVPIQEVIEP